MKTLITFLGNNNYEPTKYKINDEIIETSFFGLGLCEFLKIEKLIILGTTGSMWGDLIEYNKENEDNDEQIICLMDNVEKNCALENDLEEFSPIVKQKCNVSQCYLRIIPYGYNENEQYDLLKIMSDNIEENDKVYIDITHGFRHLPFFSLLSALYINEVKGANVEGVYYGAYEKNKEYSSVINLNEMLKVVDWIKGVSIYNATANYDVFGKLFKEAGIIENHIEIAAFYEHTFNSEKARQRLTNIHNIKSENKLFNLFRDIFLKRINWYKCDKTWQREAELARIYYEKKDYMRAYTYAFEAICTKTSHNSIDFGERNAAFEEYKDSFIKDSDIYDNIRYLKDIRNELVHGTRTKYDRVKDIVDDKGKLDEFLNKFLREHLKIN